MTAKVITAANPRTAAKIAMTKNVRTQNISFKEQARAMPREQGNPLHKSKFVQMITYQEANLPAIALQ